VQRVTGLDASLQHSVIHCSVVFTEMFDIDTHAGYFQCSYGLISRNELKLIAYYIQGWRLASRHLTKNRTVIAAIASKTILIKNLL